MVLLQAVLVAAISACATAPAGEQEETGHEPITVEVDNMSSRLITVELIVGMGGGVGTIPFGEVRTQRARPVTRRIGVVNGGSKRTLSVPWHRARLAHQILWIEGAERIASDSETLGPGQHHTSYHVETCRGERKNSCVVTYGLHLPPGAEVQLVIDSRHVATMYYEHPTQDR